MRRVLIISYYFPPVGGSGTHRPAALARHLPQYGWRPTVLTAGPEWHRDAAPESAALAGPGCDVRRTRPDAWLRFAKRLRRLRTPNLTAFARLIDPAGLWARSALAAASRMLHAEPFDAVLTTAPPYALALAGCALARRSGLPWVLDLRSPWALALAAPWLGGAGYLLDRGAPGRACARAAAVTWHDRGAMQRARRSWPGLHRRLMRWVPNGFEPQEVRVGADGADGKFRLAHVGVFYWNADRDSRGRRPLPLRLSYRPDDVDMSAQSAGFLLRAVKRLLDRKPDLRDVLRVDLVGRLHPSDERLPAELGLRDVVVLAGPLPHAQAAEYVRRADVLYLPFWWSRRVGRVIRAPSKLFEYIGARKPILAVVGPGDARDVLERAGTALFCEPSEEALAEALLRLYNQRGRPAPAADDDYIRRFEWSALAGRMAEVLDQATARAAGEGG
jgi:glycosyltransferase involved in cell wall biosynthesis